MNGLSHPEIARIKPAILREVEKNGITPHRALRLRVYLYANLNKHWRGNPPIKYLWTGIHDAIDALVQAGDIVPYQDARQTVWYGLPQHFAPPANFLATLEQIANKDRVLQNWTKAAKENDGGGKHFERLVRDAFRANGFTVSRDSTRMVFPDGASPEVDVLAISGPTVLYVECKNVVSECFQGPRPAPAHPPSDDLLKICQLFGSVSSLGGSHYPILVASLLDESLYGFVQRHRGLALRTLHQFLPPERGDLADEIRATFGIGHVKAAAQLPHFLASRLAALPATLHARYAP